MPGNLRLDVLSNFNAAYFSRGYSETNAFRDALRVGGRVRNCQRLHAKMYLFDEDTAVVTSANLTNGGIRGNLECGVLVHGPELTREVRDYFDRLWRHEVTGTIRVEVLDEIDSIVKQLPSATTEEGQAITELERALGELVLEDAEASILASLTGWRRAVFQVLTRIEDRQFQLADIYEYVPELSEQYPGNDNVEAKVRQQLQQLRDLGLLKFLGGGSYVKLWR
jgi:phosphatidylserine/phosphatidylglycerophosphate/cardiolipin synthase-like enzyme